MQAIHIEIVDSVRRRGQLEKGGAKRGKESLFPVSLRSVAMPINVRASQNKLLMTVSFRAFFNGYRNGLSLYIR